ncbi:MAG: hypothetical protein J4N29_02535, partial [Chloroflexi bacterium]|nr:hypothetical protein [Chloroflexota bacterium]
DTIVSLAVGAVAAEAGGLSAETEACIRATYEGVDVSGLVVAGDVTTEQAAPLMSAALGLLLCLDDDEASRIDAGRFLGAPGAATLQDIRCVMQRLDLSEVIGMLQGITEGGLENLPPNLIPVVLECGIDLSGGGSSDGDGAGSGGTPDAGDSQGPVPPLTPPDLSELDPELLAVVQCLREALGEEALNEIATGQRLPTLAEFGALGTCDFDLSQLGDLGDLLPSS